MQTSWPMQTFKGREIWNGCILFNEVGQLLYIENDNVGEKEDAGDVELQRIDMATWEKKTGL